MIVATEIPVCIFAKPPVPSTVKTRLIPVLGAEGAADLARAMLLDVWRAVVSCPGVRPILATTSAGDFPIRIPPDDLWLQGEGDLGQRIHRILTRGLLTAPAAMAIGADSPALTSAHIREALDTLHTRDVVLGPADDGGFYLLALRRCPPQLFSSLPWSTAGTRQALQQRLTEHSMTFAELNPLFDVDTPADLATLFQYLTANPSSSPATRAWYLNQCAPASSSPR